MDDAVLTVQQVAERLGVHHQTVRKLIRNKEIAGFRVGTAWRIPESSVTAYITKQLGGPEPR